MPPLPVPPTGDHCPPYLQLEQLGAEKATLLREMTAITLVALGLKHE